MRRTEGGSKPARSKARRARFFGRAELGCQNLISKRIRPVHHVSGDNQPVGRADGRSSARLGLVAQPPARDRPELTVRHHPPDDARTVQPPLGDQKPTVEKSVVKDSEKRKPPFSTFLAQQIVLFLFLFQYVFKIFNTFFCLAQMIRIKFFRFHRIF